MLEPLLEFARSREQSLMISTITVTRHGRGTFNKTTGTYPDTVTVLYAGQAWIPMPADMAPRPREVGDRKVSMLNFNIVVPHDADVSAVARGDIVAASGIPELEVLEVSRGTTALGWTIACQEKSS